MLGYGIIIWKMRLVTFKILIIKAVASLLYLRNKNKGACFANHANKAYFAFL